MRQRVARTECAGIAFCTGIENIESFDGLLTRYFSRGYQKSPAEISHQREICRRDGKSPFSSLREILREIFDTSVNV